MKSIKSMLQSGHYRANKPLPEQPILGYYQAANLYDAVKAAAQWKAPALLLSGQA
jgi:hypothetical protein